MVVTDQFIKEKTRRPVVFIGPCMSKKLESLQGEARKAIDRVLTFEEMVAVFRAADADLTRVEELPKLKNGVVAHRRLFAGPAA